MSISCMEENITPYRHMENRPGMSVSIATSQPLAPGPTKMTARIDRPSTVPPMANHLSVDLHRRSAMNPPSGAATSITT